MFWHTPETATMSGASGESLQFLIIQSQSVPAEYIVFLFEASLPAAAFFPQEPHTKHTKNKHTPRNRSCVSHSQPPADCEVTNEHCHPAKHLLALLLQLCTEVLPFCFRVCVCRCARVCACVRVQCWKYCHILMVIQPNSHPSAFVFLPRSKYVGYC